jgi:hypothetical protein
MELWNYENEPLWNCETAVCEDEERRESAAGDDRHFKRGGAMRASTK